MVVCIIHDIGVTDMMKSILEKCPVVPVVVLDDASKAVPVARALVAGGITVIEVTMRTDAAPDAVSAISEQVPEILVGAGTVLNAEQAETIVSAGAKFIVSPGLLESVVTAGRGMSIPVIPGVATATEVLQAWNLGLRILKLFPVSAAGGVSLIKELSSVFRDVQFMLTGGISTANLKGYLSPPSVLACGGIWLTPAETISNDDFEEITRLASEAMTIAKEVKVNGCQNFYPDPNNP